MKNENAITMIATIVTIIVLLILASITVGLAIVNNGLLNRARGSYEVHEEVAANEAKALEEADEGIRAEESSLLSEFKKGNIRVGDYVEYITPESGSFTTNKSGDENSNGFATQTYDVSNNGEAINWRILGMVDSEGKLTLDKSKGTNLALISGSPVQKKMDSTSSNDYDKNPYLYMGKAHGYVNAVRILNKISEIYVNDTFAVGARSINVDDINTILGIETDYNSGTVYEKSDSNRTNIDILRVMDKIFNYSENDYSANSFINNKTKAIQNGEARVVGTAYCYSTSSFNNRAIGGTTFKNLLFNQSDFDGNNAKAYWLASTGIEVDKTVGFGIGEVYLGNINIGDGKFYSNGSWYVLGLGVRPMIILKKNITKDELPIVERSETTWSYKNNIAYMGNVSNYDEIGTKINIF